MQKVRFAIIRLFDTTGKQIAQTVTDMNGKYSFIADPGKYIVTAEHEDYRKLQQEISIDSEDTIVTENLEMEKGNSELGTQYKLRNKFAGFIIKTSWFIGMVGIIFSLIAYLQRQETVTLVILVLYLLQLLLIIIFRQNRNYGIVFDEETEEGVKGAFIQVFDVLKGRQIDVMLTDNKGRFIFNLEKGSYILLVYAKGKTLAGSDLEEVKMADGRIGLKYHTKLKGIEIALK